MRRRPFVVAVIGGLALLGGLVAPALQPPPGAEARHDPRGDDGRHTSPPESVRLRELRREVQATQTDIAKRRGVGRAAVSELERSEDLTIRSLERYVRASGGERELRVRVRDEVFKLSRQGEHSEHSDGSIDRSSRGSKSAVPSDAV